MEGGSSVENLLSKVISDPDEANYDVTPEMELQEHNIDEESQKTYEYEHLSFVLAQYAINGTFLGYTDLAEQVFMCPSNYKDILSMRRFGTQMVSECDI